MNDLGTLLLVKNCPIIVKKCTGEVGDNGDIAKNDNIAMQIFKSDTIRRNGHRKNDIALFALCALMRVKVQKVQSKK